MTVSNITCVVGMGKSSVSRTLYAFKDSRSLSPNRKVKCGRKRKTTPLTDQLLLRNSRLRPTMTSKDIQRDLLASGIDIDSSTVWCMLPEFGWKDDQKRLLMPAMEQKQMAWANKYRSWTTDGWMKVAFSDEFVQG
jgi:transposase